MKRGEVILDRFETLSVAGAGAMGVVWRAVDRTSGLPVALKILRAGSDADRFAREARLLAELEHPGIVKYIAHGITEEGPCLVMEWLDGESLDQRLGRAELTVSESVAVVGRIASAIGAAHRRFVVHRDLKPSNVFLVSGSLEDIRVLDFGIARHGALASDLTQSGVILGSPRYMAPEQARGSRDISPRADVWALGAILFRCLTGKPLLPDGPIEMVLADLLLGPVPHVGDSRPDLPADLDAIVARMLAKDPVDRFADGNAVAEALSILRISAHDSAPPPSVGREPTGLTLFEQRFTCVILAQGLRGAGAEPLRSLVGRYGGTLTVHPSGRVEILISARGTATDLAAQAARCALQIRAAHPDAALAIAMGTGPVAGEGRPEQTIVARAEELLDRPRESSGKGVLLDGASVGLLDTRFEIDSHGEHAVLVGEVSEAAPVRRLLGRPTPCVGRERELTTLAALVEQCLGESTASVALITGAAGVGKSRVRYELLRRLDEIASRLGCPMPEIWVGRADPMSAGSPFGLLSSALRGVLGLQLGVPADSQRAAIELRVARHVAPEHVARVARGLADILGVTRTRTTESSDRTIVDPLLLGDQMRTAWEDFLEAECAAEPVLLVLEDLHWGDWATVRFVEAALRHLRNRPFLVLALARPEVFDLMPGLFADRELLHVRLGELGAKASERLVRAVLGHRVDDARVAWLAERAAGNAFFLEELIRAVAEDPASESLPPSVLAMAQLRIEALGAEARQVLRAASVFGQVFWQGGVAALLHGARSELEVRDWLEHLVQHELLSRRRTSRYAAQTELVFRHGLVRDAAYAMLTDDDRRLGHRLAAAWLDGLGEREPLVLAEHHVIGAEPARAAPLYLRAAQQALEGNDFAAVLRHTESAIACGAAGEELGELELLRAAAHQWRGEMADRERAARRAMAELRPLSRRWYAAAAETARIASRLGRHDELAALLDTLATDDAAETAAARAVVLAQLGVAAMRAGLPEARDRIFALLDRTERALGPRDAEGEAWASRLRGYRALVEGDTASYLRFTEAAVTAFTRAEDQRNALTFQTSVGFANIALGRYAQAEQTLRDALGRAERLNLALTRAIAKHNLGYAVAGGGRLAEGIAIEREAAADAAAQNDRWIECVSLTYLADLLVRAGEPLEAEQMARRALALSDKPNRTLVLALLSRALTAQGRGAEAREAALEASRLLAELGGIEDGDALVRLTAAEALHAAGDRAGARDAIVQAAARLEQRAAKISEEELRQSFLTRVPEHARTLELAASWGR